MNTKVTPRFLEYVRQWQEVHRYILIRHCRQAVVMCMELFQIAGMMQHDPFRFARCSGRIKDIRQIIVRSAFRTCFHRIIMRESLPHCHKFIKVDRRYITRVFHHRTVKDNQLLQGRTETENAESSIILKLFPHKKVTNLRIIADVLRLRRRTGRIQRNGNSAIGKCTKVNIEPFGLIL